MVLHVSARVIWNTELAWRVKTRSAWWRAPLTKWRPSFKTVSKSWWPRLGALSAETAERIQVEQALRRSEEALRRVTDNMNDIISSSRDVTEGRQAEIALRESETRYRAIVEDQTELICRRRPDGTLTFVNEAYCRYFGKQHDELTGRSFMPLIPEDHATIAANTTTLSLANPVVTYEHCVILPGGNLRWQQWTDRAIFDQDGQLSEFQSVGRDITERKQAEEALRQLNEELEDRVQERTAQLSASLQEKEVLLREIHHLVSNALKHAFPGTRTGTIGIDLCREQDGRLSLSVRDDGVGVPDDLDVRCAKSLGLQLVSTLVDQLEGTVEVQRNGGTSFQIIFSDPNMKRKGSSNA
jgi:PAS domain S-box-containing protein